MTTTTISSGKASNGTLPSGWRMARFGDVVRNVDVSERSPLENGIDRYVGLDHLDPESLHIKRWGNVANGTTFTRKFKPGQVLFGKRRAYQRKAAVAEFEGICSGDILVFEPANGELIPELLPFIVQSDGFFNHALGTSAGSLSPRTKWKDLADYEFALPPRNEQQRIVEILWATETLVRELESALISADRFQETSLAELLSKGVGNRKHPLQDSKFGKVPSHWRICPISEVAEVEYGISEAVASNNDPTIGWPILTNANITLEGELDFSKLNYITPPKKSSFVLRKGDLLLVWRSGSPEHVGKTAIFNLDQSYTHASFLLRIRASKEVNNIFLHRLLNFMRKRGLFKADTSQQVNFKMNASVFREVPVLVPPLDEQEEMLQIFLTIEHARNAIFNKIQNTRNLYKQLIAYYFG